MAHASGLGHDAPGRFRQISDRPQTDSKEPKRQLSGQSRLSLFSNSSTGSRLLRPVNSMRSNDSLEHLCPRSISSVSESKPLRRQTSMLSIAISSAIPNPSIPDKRFLRLGEGGVQSALPHRTESANRIRHAVKHSLATPNGINTRRFTWFTWLPLSLYWQMRRVANIYFLTIASLATTPLWARKWASKVMMVTIVLMLQAIKDLFEDLKRGRDDEQDNTRHVLRYEREHNKFVAEEWQYCTEGELLLIREGELIPADVLVLTSSKSSGVCSISTKSLDGETNLKQRQGPEVVQRLVEGLELEELNELAEHIFDAGFECVLSKPHVDLHELDGSITVNGEKAGIGSTSFALRGCKLELTDWILCFVCYVGNETKVMLNTGRAPTKHSEMERLLNKCVMSILVFIIMTSTLFMIYASVMVPHGLPFYEVWVKYFIIQYPIMPMTLYIAFEMMHLMIGWQIQTDPLMYDKSTESHAEARNSALVEELGQVDYVFSDKTGTLTANEMRFAFGCIAGHVVGSFLPGAPSAKYGLKSVKRDIVGGGNQDEKQEQMTERTREFFEFLAVCHTVLVAEPRHDEVQQTLSMSMKCVYNGESPDEVALTEGAAMVGVRMVERHVGNSGSVTHVVKAPWYQGGRKSHHVSHVIEFNSDRKRMSVIVCEPDGGAVVLTKGADSVMQELLSEPLPRNALKALDHFSHQGLRTLVLGKRLLSPAEYASWKSRRDEAKLDLLDRAKRLADVEAEVESGLSYVGVTALEDRLQDNVPATIIRLRQAGMRVWMLTGDKVETAIEVAKACHLFDGSTQLVKIVGVTSAEHAVDICRHSCKTVVGEGRTRGIVLDGSSARLILESEAAMAAFYKLAEASGSCVCCRLSPLQKRQLVELVCQRNKKAITLAIGDGANDVPMIQGAHLGIGIRGKEGASAVQASDMAISQFEFVGNLLLCHGRRAYLRTAAFLGFFLYKSVVVTWGYILYAWDDSCQGKLAYPEWLDITYNPFTSGAVLLVLVLDFDISDRAALDDPSVYWPGPHRTDLNKQVFLGWMASACLHGILCWSVPVYYLTTKYDRIHQTDAFWAASFTAYAAVIIVVHLKLVLLTRSSITKLGVGAVLLELSAFAAAAVVLSLPIGAKLSPELKGVPAVVFSSRHHVGCLLLPPFVSILVDFMAGALNAKVAKIWHSGERKPELTTEAPHEIVRMRSMEFQNQMSLASCTPVNDTNANKGFSGLDKIPEFYMSEGSDLRIVASSPTEHTGSAGKNTPLTLQKPRSPASSAASSAKAYWTHLRGFACCRGGPPPADDRPGQPLLPARTNGHNDHV